MSNKYLFPKSGFPQAPFGFGIKRYIQSYLPVAKNNFKILQKQWYK